MANIHPESEDNPREPDYAVMIVACGSTRGGGLVYGVAVTQPVQSWTVIRSHEDFVAMGDALANSVPGITPCPAVRAVGGNLPDMMKQTSELQDWLTTTIMCPGARESTALVNFLIYGANTVPPQYESVSWTALNTFMTPAPPPDVGSPISNHHSSQDEYGDVDDMDMDDMYVFGDEGNNLQNDDHDDDEEDVPPASVRYKPTDEGITDQDELDLLQVAGEVEMVEDVTSLAQSMGASGFGRSLMRQEEMKQPTTQQPQVPAPQQGLQVGGSSHTSNHSSDESGGIGGAMAKAAQTRPPHHNGVPTAPRLDSFKMIKVIGKGSFGKVFLVKENKTGQIYALKVLRKDNIIKRNQVEHTKTERSVLGYVRHPFIVGMNMAFQSKDKLYFVLDYCAGGELFFHLGKLGKFPEPRARFYAAEITLAISYVHSLDIIYRDLKPENVLLDANGHIRLTDFGLSKEGISSSSSGANSFCGTPEYLAPEILNRQGHGRAVDWWSLGALLYEMITGLPPFYCQDRERLFEKIQKSELHYPQSVSRPAKNLLKGLLTKDPTRRLGSGPTDAEEIKTHEFFVEIIWDKLAKGDVPPPWRPNISGSLDTSQFDKEFTSMPIFSPQSMQRPHGFGVTPADNPFLGFTFTNETILHGPR